MSKSKLPKKNKEQRGPKKDGGVFDLGREGNPDDGGPQRR